MRKTSFLVEERRASVSEEEARETVRRRVTLWLKRAVREQCREAHSGSGQFPGERGADAAACSSNLPNCPGNSGG